MKMSSCKNMMNMNMIACLSLMVMVGLMQGATAAVYDVGGSLGWTVPPNTSFYSDWAASRTFQKGDVVTFNCTGNHTVAEVSTEEYDNCTNPGLWIASPLIYSPELTSGGSRYFICITDDHCERGQKVTITVGSTTSAAPSSVLPATVASLLGLIVSTLTLSFCTYM